MEDNKIESLTEKQKLALEQSFFEREERRHDCKRYEKVGERSRQKLRHLEMNAELREKAQEELSK